MVIAAIACRETPGLIPNPAVKLTHVVCCTEVRESPGTIPSCYHLSFLHGSVLMKFLLTSDCARQNSVIIAANAIPQVHDLNDT